MIVYMDITQVEKGRTNTGIQRVVKEFLKRAIDNTEEISYKILIYNPKIKKMQILPNKDIKLFFKDTVSFKFRNRETIEIEEIKPSQTTVYLDIDSPWNAMYKRELLYPILKNNGFLIFNFIYDLVPIIMPHLAHEQTVQNFSTFLTSIYKYSDLVFFDSTSAQVDFTEYKSSLGIQKDISTRIVGLGSDFLYNDIIIQDEFTKNLLEKKYILFVGTIEPRKNQEDLLHAFEILSKKYPDLHLVIIGKEGWKVKSLISKIKNHPLKGKKLFWLNNIDDGTLKCFYQNAFLVTYLSQYEGYGLPIAESLSFGNITITSKNSSMYEVGLDYADYINYNTENELVEIISLYYENENLYKLKKDYIKNNYKLKSWDTFATSITDVFKNYEESIVLKNKHLEKLQFVFISIEIESIKGTIESIDKYVDFIKEYIIVTAPNFLKEFEQLTSKYKITIVDETTILRDYASDFHKRDHVSKNWLLRTSLVNLKQLDDEYIMLDDDNRVLKPITIDKFITKDGKYNAYFFYNLLDWHHTGTDYDKGQQNMKEVLSEKNYELFSYSSHAPQIINKKIFKEVVDKFFTIGLSTPIDEWSIYFNYAISTYPHLFNKKFFETINWPGGPESWDCKFNVENISFENYYKNLYDSSFFTDTMTYHEKIQKKIRQLKPYVKTNEIFQNNLPILSQNNMVHGSLAFKNNDMEFYLFNIPYYIVVVPKAKARLRINYKLLNLKEKNLDISITVSYNEKVKIVKKLSTLTNHLYQESIVELPIESQGLDEGIYNLTINLNVDNDNIFKKTSPYLVKLIVSSKQNYLNTIMAPSILPSSQKSLKNKLKEIPFLGFISRWSYNLLRLNNIKHTLFINTKKISKLQDKVIKQEQSIERLEKKIESLEMLNDLHEKDMKQRIEKSVSKQISFQSDSFQQRLDQFIFDAKIELDLKND